MSYIIQNKEQCVCLHTKRHTMYTSIITYLLVNYQDVLLDKIITKELLINSCMSLLIDQISINKSSISYHHVHVSWALFYVIYVATNQLLNTIQQSSITGMGRLSVYIIL